MQGGIGATLMSVAMIGAIILAGGGAWMIAKRGERQKGLLMIAVAIILLGNVLIWTV